jgi:hypothetical protein
MLDATIELQQLLDNKTDKNNTAFYMANVNRDKKNINNNIKNIHMLTYEINENNLDDNDLGNGIDVQTSYLDDAREKEEDEQKNYYNVGLDNHNELSENLEY